jgi:Spy/CpxP family protein refolding chaperone
MTINYWRKIVMSRMKYVLGALVGALLCAGPALACGGQGGGKFGEHMAAALRLSDAQKTSVKEVIAGYRADLKAKFAAIRTAQAAVQDAIHADPFDEQTVRAAARSLAAQEEELFVLKGELASKMRPILTPDQQLALKNLAAQARGHHGHGWRGQE